MEAHRTQRAIGAIVCSVIACNAGGSQLGSDAPSRASPSAPESPIGKAEPGTTMPSPSPGGAGVTPPPPPEKPHVESEFLAPVATGKFVWIANPLSGRVALVDAKSLVVQTVAAGNGPTYLAPVPGDAEDTTIVLNVVSNDATWLHATQAGIATATYPTTPGANAWAFAKNGAYAIAWADARQSPNAVETQGFQDITVIDLGHGTATALSVGYRPVGVTFAADGTRAFAVTEDGISVVDTSVTPPRVTKNVAIAASPQEDPATRQVVLTPDGAFAFVRHDGSPNLTAISLADGKSTEVVLPGAVTDIGVSDTGDKLVAVVRDASDALILPVPAIVATPTTFATVTVTGETIGSVALTHGGGAGLLYTSATPVERLTVLDLGAMPTFRTVRLHSPVRAVFTAPDAANAIVLHDTTGSPGEAGAFSIVPLTVDLPAKIVQTQAPPTAVAMVADRAIVAERDAVGQVSAVHVVRMPELSETRIALASPVTAVGIVPAARRAYAAEAHPDGRITFVDLDTNEARTLTGFELAARVVDGSQP
jgi:hypothetical protein